MQKIVKIGIKWLKSLSTLSGEKEICKINLMKLANNLSSEQDAFSWLCVIQSLIASSKNTFYARKFDGATGNSRSGMPTSIERD